MQVRPSPATSSRESSSRSSKARTAGNGQTTGVNVGLGLYIVKQIVEAHEGTVDVCSREGKGTSFVVKLPRSPHGADA